MRVNASVRRSAGIYQMEGSRGGHLVYHAVKRWNGPVKKFFLQKMSILFSWCWSSGSAMLSYKMGFQNRISPVLFTQNCDGVDAMTSGTCIYSRGVYTVYTANVWYRFGCSVTIPEARQATAVYQTRNWASNVCVLSKMKYRDRTRADIYHHECW